MNPWKRRAYGGKLSSIVSIPRTTHVAGIRGVNGDKPLVFVKDRVRVVITISPQPAEKGLSCSRAINKHREQNSGRGNLGITGALGKKDSSLARKVNAPYRSEQEKLPT